MKKAIFLIIILFIFVGAGIYIASKIVEPFEKVITFEECVAGGNPVMESYPRQCRIKSGQVFTEYIPSPSVSFILSAENEFPAAGICAEPGEEDAISVEINPDTPSPRCQKVVAGKRLIVKNNTDEELSMWFGKNKDYSFSVPAKGEYAVPKLPDEFLAPGVHSLYGAPYQGPEIWLIGNQGNNGILPYDSGVSGMVSIGPTCPVVKNPPDPACADRPYKTTVQVILVNSPKSSPFAIVESDGQGRYTIMLPPGEYALQPAGGSPLPRCETKNITIESKMIKEIDLSCDSGIR